MTYRAYSALMNASGTVSRATVSYTSTGPAKRIWEEVSTVRCRLHKMAYGNAANFAMQGIIEAPSHKLFLEAEADVLTDDMIRIEGVDYSVLDVFPPGGVTHHKEAYIRHAGLSGD